LQETIKMCRKIFSGEDVKISEKSEEYATTHYSLYIYYALIGINKNLQEERG
jgi:hypothetical protein